MPISRKHNFAHPQADGHHGLYLVAKPTSAAQTPRHASGAVYRIVAVGAALFLAMTVC